MSEADDLTQERDDDNDVIRQLRAKLKEAKQERKDLAERLETLEPQVRGSILSKLGVDPESPQAKALTRLHEGEWDEEAVRATAVEYGYLSEDGGSTEENLSPAEQQREQSLERGRQTAAAGTPLVPQPLDEQIAEAEKAGDIPLSMALKRQKLEAASA